MSTSNDDRLPPANTGNLEADHAINAEISYFNRTGNMLALWAVLDVSAKFGVTVPTDVVNEFAKIGAKMIGHALEGTIGARDLAADLVLGTRNSSGGSVFKDYATHATSRAIIQRVRQLLLQDLEDRQSTPGASSYGVQTRVYKKVAEEFGKEPEMIKRLFEEDDMLHWGRRHYHDYARPSEMIIRPGKAARHDQIREFDRLTRRTGLDNLAEMDAAISENFPPPIAWFDLQLLVNVLRRLLVGASTCMSDYFTFRATILSPPPLFLRNCSS
ncbi:hypothetical protein [Tardiphaga robiniae]|uniref:hypothetical protein n=1 Tax=Tardiphaga robiniae TaxID=943830 RepID=UPI001585DCA0|nr:hypothetical protein [Tardiphaga robiniae]NUU41842.1 hypothetical protein [Tardiphaga robiniae]